MGVSCEPSAGRSDTIGVRRTVMRKSVYCRGPVMVPNGSRMSWSSMAGRVLSIVAVVMLVFASVFGMVSGTSAAFADDPNSDQTGKHDDWLVNLACGNDLGLNTAHNPFWNLASPNPSENSGFNKVTMQDVYGGRLNWTTYNGTNSPNKVKTGSGNIFNFTGDTADRTGIQSRLDSSIQNSAYDAHDWACPVRAATTMISGTLLGIGDMISSFTSLFVSSAVDPNFICNDPANPQGMCINLLAVIAGDGATGSDGGIIGRLFNGMYMGLCVMVFAGVGIWAAWHGLVKRKLTSALAGIAGAVGIFGLGVIFMSQPLFFAKLPMQIGTTLGGCVVMGMNGQNCLSTNEGDNPNSTGRNTECYVDTRGRISATRAMALSAKMASCKTWKAFVWEPWVTGQFGTSYSELFTGGDSNPAGPLFQNAKTKDALSYWKNIKVNLYTNDGRIDGMCSNTNAPLKYQYSNLALYQADLMSDPAIHACNRDYHKGTGIRDKDNVYSDWMWIVDAMTQARSTKNETGADNISIMWSSWTGDNVGGRFQIALIALLASGMGAVVLITTAILAMVYLFMSVLLTAFAPLFFLMGIMPGQGKKLFLGWVEKLVSNLLKYFGCVLWMMVTLELYASVLGNVNSNIGITFIFTIIVTMAMWMYRGEFLKMIGKANLGGTQFSNAMGDWVKNKANSVKDTALATGAGYVGGLVAGRSADKQKLNHKKYKAGQVVNGKTLTQSDADELNIARKKANKEKRAFNRTHGRLNAARDGAGFQLTQSMKKKGGVIGQAAMVNDRIRDDRRKKDRINARKTNNRAQQLVASQRETLNAQGIANSDITRALEASHGDSKEAVRLLQTSDSYKNIEQRAIDLETKASTLHADAVNAKKARSDVDAFEDVSTMTGAAHEMDSILDAARSGEGNLGDLLVRFNDLQASADPRVKAMLLRNKVSASTIEALHNSHNSGYKGPRTLSRQEQARINTMSEQLHNDALAEFNVKTGSSSTSYADVQAHDAKLNADFNEAQKKFEDAGDAAVEAQALRNQMLRIDDSMYTMSVVDGASQGAQQLVDDLDQRRLSGHAKKRQRRAQEANEAVLDQVSTINHDGRVVADERSVLDSMSQNEYERSEFRNPMTSAGNKKLTVSEVLAGETYNTNTASRVGGEKMVPTSGGPKASKNPDAQRTYSGRRFDKPKKKK